MKLSQTNGMIFDYYASEEETVKHMHDAGFHCMDVSFFTRFIPGSKYWNDDYMTIAKRYKEALKKYDITAVQCHGPAGNFLGDDGGEYGVRKTVRAMTMAAEIGIPSMTIHPGSYNNRTCSQDEFISKNVEVISRLIPYAEKYNMYLLIENIGNIFENGHYYTMNASQLCQLVDAFHHELVAVNLDIGHDHANGNDSYDTVIKCGKRIRGVHVHDNHGIAMYPDKIGGSDEHLMPYSGNLNFDKFIRGLIDVGYQGTFNFEVEGIVGNKANPKLTPEIRLEFDRVLYAIGKNMLSSYGIFEE